MSHPSRYWFVTGGLALSLLSFAPACREAAPPSPMAGPQEELAARAPEPYERPPISEAAASPPPPLALPVARVVPPADPASAPPAAHPPIWRQPSARQPGLARGGAR